MAGDSDIIKLGPFGYKGGKFWDGKGHSDIVQIFVSSYNEKYITSIQYQYVENGRLMLSELHGDADARGNKFDVVKLNYPTEYITCIRGYTNLFLSTLCSVTFGTNLGEYGPFSKCEAGRDTEFRVMLGENRQFFGFHGSASSRVHSIGVYMKPNIALDSLVKKERIN